MFIVQNVYKDKAQNYVLRHGKANFSQGALAHDFINAVERHGLMPEETFSGLDEGVSRHNHGEMEAMLTGMLEAIVKRPKPSKKWATAFSSVLDVYLGKAPEQFTYEGRTFTPKEFSKNLGFRAEDYVNITSFQHHPFHKDFVLEIPDNYSNGSFYNLPIEEVMEIIENAVTNGYTLAWDGDVSERGFSSGNGLAVLPVASQRRESMKKPVDEIEVTQEMRQESFLNYVTTDDHLMHLTGIATDQNGTKYFIIKNSWGEVGSRKGYLYMSEAYARLKTMAILVHKDALPEHLRK
jgi:bleomycin hydrolase